MGDVLLLKEDKFAKITAWKTRTAQELVYNFQVDVLHNYAVGDGQVLVHNNSAIINENLVDDAGRPSIPPQANNVEIKGRAYVKERFPKLAENQYNVILLGSLNGDNNYPCSNFLSAALQSNYDWGKNTYPRTNLPTVAVKQGYLDDKIKELGDFP